MDESPKTPPRPIQIALPFWERVIFVDWHGVLCSTPFWHTILGRRSNPLHKRVKSATESLFSERRDLVKVWMRGQVSSAQIVEALDIALDRARYKERYLHWKLYRDCRRMGFDTELLSMLQEYRQQAFLVLATDNMDCFAASINDMDGLVGAFDYVLCSSEMGVLKSDGVNGFFGPWLVAHGLTFRNAILIDDSLATCDAFTMAGGASVPYRGVQAAHDQLQHWFANSLAPTKAGGAGSVGGDTPQSV